MYIDYGTSGWWTDAKNWGERQYETAKEYKEKYDEYSKKAGDITDIVTGEDDKKKEAAKKKNQGKKTAPVVPTPDLPPGVTPAMFWSGVGALALVTYLVVRR